MVKGGVLPKDYGMFDLEEFVRYDKKEAKAVEAYLDTFISENSSKMAFISTGMSRENKRAFVDTLVTMLDYENGMWKKYPDSSRSSKPSIYPLIILLSHCKVFTSPSSDQSRTG